MYEWKLGEWLQGEGALCPQDQYGRSRETQLLLFLDLHFLSYGTCMCTYMQTDRHLKHAKEILMTI